MNILPIIAMLILLSGCGGFRGGIESVPYVGEPHGETSSAHPRWLHELVLPDFVVRLSLNNALRTYQYEVMLYIIPTYINLWDEFWNRDADGLELTLQVVAKNISVTLDPRELVLTVDGQDARPSGVWVNNTARERQVIDTFVKARRQAPPDQPPSVPKSSEWRDEVFNPVTLQPGEASPRFIVVFPLALVSPEKSLGLDLNRAVIEPRRPEIPPIQFKPMSWKEGYS